MFTLSILLPLSMTDLQIHVHSLDEIKTAAKDFLEALGDSRVFAFSAPMGTGKTTFINALLNAMGIVSLEGSPTYSLVNVYDSPMFGRIYHMDMYRLNSASEALDIGVEEILYSGDLCFIEWPEKIMELLPEKTVHLNIQILSDGSRVITALK